jgi:hypothetical protein
VKVPQTFFLAFIFVLSAIGISSAATSDVYVTPDGSPQGVCTTSPHNPAWFNSASNWGSTIGPGTTIHLCGTFNGSAGSTEFTFMGNGTSGNPITLLFEANAQLSAPYWAPSSGGQGCGGAICMYNRSYIIVDGGSNGIIRNTANGDSLANQQDTEAIEGTSCNNCTVRNLAISNIYVHNQNGNGSIDDTQMRCISISGSNWTINNNVMHDSGWCLFQAYSNGDSNVNIYGNNIYNMNHGWMLATSSANSFTNAFFHDNQVHDAANWDANGCPFHHDGIHTFGTSGSTMSGIYVSDNYFYGNWGTCPTGYVFVEGGASSTPSHMQSSYWWNNLVVVSPASPIVNTNGWIDIASGENGSQKVYDNTIIGPNNSDNTNCIAMEGMSGLTFENNVVSNCGDPVRIDKSTMVGVDYNFYGTSCGNGNNCFIWNGSFTGSFSAWKSACNCDSHTLQNNNPLLSANGAPQAGSPVIEQGLDLSNAAAGNMASLASDTSMGNTRPEIARPTGTCSTRGTAACWDIGAFQYGNASGPSAPTGLTASIQ